MKVTLCSFAATDADDGEACCQVPQDFRAITCGLPEVICAPDLRRWVRSAMAGRVFRLLYLISLRLLGWLTLVSLRPRLRTLSCWCWDMRSPCTPGQSEAAVDWAVRRR
jgi:hypothetical protein